MKHNAAYASQFLRARASHRALNRLLVATEIFAALVLAADVLVVLCSVVWRYFLHDPVDWAEEIARALMGMQVFLARRRRWRVFSMSASTACATCFPHPGARCSSSFATGSSS